MYVLLLILKFRKNSCFCFLGVIIGMGVFFMVYCVDWSLVSGMLIIFMLVG